MSKITGLAKCHYVKNESNTQGQNASKGYIAQQEITPESPTYM